MTRNSGSFGTPIYGWVIVVVAALAMVATLPGRTHGLGMITERLLGDERLELTRIGYSNINLWATLLGGLFCLPCGWLIDRLGLRITLSVTVAALAAAVLWMTHIGDASSFFVAILLTRGFGQSALSVISITMVGKWFPGKLSFPMAVYTLLMSLGFGFSMQLTKRFAENDWQVLWNAMGYSLAAFVPLALIFTRDPPQNPESATSATEAELAKTEQIGFTLGQAMSTSTFWVFGIAISLVALIGSGVSLFNESVLKQQGFPKETFYNLFTLTSTVGLFCQLPVGWLGQRVSLNRLLTGGLLLQSLCMALLPMVRTQWGITLYGIGMGVAGTITTVLFFTIWGQAYGKRHLGKIQSIAQMMTVLASALGPRLFAEWFEGFGSYAGIFYILSMTAALIAAWSWFVRVPRPEQSLTTDPVDAPLLVQPALQKVSP